MERRNNQYTDSIRKLAESFSERIRKYGDGPECAEHSDLASQEKRMRILCGYLNPTNQKILDFGCATGHLLTLLRSEYGYTGDYVGVDVSEEMISAAKAKHSDARFECRNILQDPLEEDFDLILISGTFNDLITNNWGWMQETLRVLFSHCAGVLAFNNLSRYVDYFDDHLFYVDPGEVFRFAKEELSPLVTIKHDYETRAGVVPYEFSTFVHATEIDCRRLAREE